MNPAATVDNEWSVDPDRNCAVPEDWTNPGDIRLWADQWFPRHETPAAATELCDGCPVKTLCLTYALENELEGIWGGTTTKQRASARRKGAAA